MIRSFVLFAALATVWWGCSEKAANRQVEITHASGYFARLTVDDEVSMATATGALRSETRRSDKRKYYNSSNVMQYAVKFDDDGFKLRDQQEQLLWKVKLYPDKIKVANNESMTGAYELKLKEAGRLKFERDNVEISQLRLMPDAASVTVNGYELTGFGESLAAGIALINEIPDDQKVLLMGELLLRSR